MAAPGHWATVVVAVLLAVCPGWHTVAHAGDVAYPYSHTSPAGDRRLPPDPYPAAHIPQTVADPMRLESELAASRAELRRTAERLEATQFLLQKAREALARNYSESRRLRESLAEQAERLAGVAALENQLAQLRATNRQLHARSVGLTERQETVESGYRTCQDRLTALDADLATADAARITAQQTLTDTLDERDRLRAELEAVTATLQERQAALAHAERDARQTELAAQVAGLRNIDAAPDEVRETAPTPELAGKLAETRAALDAELAAKAAMQQALADAISTRERLLALLDTVNGRLAEGAAGMPGQVTQNGSPELLQACNERLAAAMVALSATSTPASDVADADEAQPPPSPQTTDLAALESASAGKRRGDRDADGIDDGRDLCPDSPEGASVDAAGCLPDAPIALAGVNFRYDSDALTEPSRAELDRIARILLEQPTLRLEIAGHTDAQGDAAYNLWLSEQRANSVMAYLVTRGVSPARLTARGYGGTQPVAANSSREGLARNRRVELRRQP